MFTPDSRIALAENVTPEFSRSWNERARYSYRMYQSLLRLADQPVEYLDSYSVDGGQDAAGVVDANDRRPAFAQLSVPIGLKLCQRLTCRRARPDARDNDPLHLDAGQRIVDLPQVRGAELNR